MFSDKNKQLIIKNLLLILVIIIVCAFLIRYLTSGETLSDYAAGNNGPIYAEEQ